MKEDKNVSYNVMTNRLLSVRQATEVKGVSPLTIYKWMESGQINGFIVDKTFIVIDDDKFKAKEKKPRSGSGRKRSRTEAVNK